MALFHLLILFCVIIKASKVPMPPTLASATHLLGSAFIQQLAEAMAVHAPLVTIQRTTFLDIIIQLYQKSLMEVKLTSICKLTIFTALSASASHQMTTTTVANQANFT